MADLLKRCRLRLRSIFRKDHVEHELDEELQYHLSRQMDEAIAAGLSPEEARYTALREMGAIAQNKEKCRDMRRVNLIENLVHDLRYALRTLRKKPVISLTAILTLALGIGANTAVFTVLYGLLLRSLPVPHANQLARINMTAPVPGARVPVFPIQWRMWQQLRSQQRSFTDVSAWTMNVVFMPDNEGTLRMYESSLVSGNGFSLLGVKPSLGRLIEPSDDVRGGPPQGWPVVLSYSFWKDQFGGDPNIIGRQLRLSNSFVTVTGITPRDFQGVMAGRRPKMYLPMHFGALLEGGGDLNSPSSHFRCFPIGRLKPGVSIAEANAEIAVYKNDLFNNFLPPQLLKSPLIQSASFEVKSARSGLPLLDDSFVRPLMLVQGLVGIVLLLCCVNVGGLMMSNIEARRQEFAVRTALGAARARLVGQYLTESLVIASAGALLGAVAAWYGTAFLLRFSMDPNGQEGLSVRPDMSVFLAAGSLAILATFLFGSLPAWRAGRADPGALLKSRTAAGLRKHFAGQAFVPIQVALSLVLVVTAGLLSQSLIRLRTEDTGFDLKHITITTPIFNRLPQKGDALLDLYQRMVDRLEQMPGIQSAAVTWYTPMTNSQAVSGFQALVGGPNPPEDMSMAFNDVGPGYFRTMGTSILSGREFERNERERSICILNQSAADYLFPHQQAISQYVRSTDPRKIPETVSCRVIGISADAKYASARGRAPRTIYFPVTKLTVANGNLVFLMRSAKVPDAISGYRTALRDIAPHTALLRFATLQQQMDDSFGPQRLLTLLCNTFGVLALFLSAIGLYGLLASSVARRTGEIGVRIALGARRSDILKLILNEAMRLLIVGILLGSFALFAAVRLVQGMLYGVSPYDPATLAVAAALLTAVALFAAFVPARRAASVDPMQALRTE